MNKDEFNSFMAHVAETLPNFTAQLLGKDESKQIQENWSRFLYKTELDDAKETVDEIATGDLPRPFIDEFVPLILDRCRQKERRRATVKKIPAAMDDRRHRKLCHICQDTGWAAIIHWDMLEAVRAGIDSPLYRKCCVRCSCSTGEERMKEFSSGRLIPTLGSDWHIHWTGDYEEDLRAVRTFVYERVGAPEEVF